MIRTPESTSPPATCCACSAGTATTPTMMFFSRTVSASVRASLIVIEPIVRPTLSGSLSNTAAMLIPCSAQIGEQRVDVVADAALAELAEGREVAPNLRRVDVRVVRDLLRGDSVLAHLLGLGQNLQVPTQASGDADRQPIAVHAHLGSCL